MLKYNQLLRFLDIQVQNETYYISASHIFSFFFSKRSDLPPSPDLAWGWVCLVANGGRMMQQSMRLLASWCVGNMARSNQHPLSDSVTTNKEL